MAFDENYAERVRMALSDVPNVTERKMFGSLGFMINGHLAAGVGDGSDGSVLMIRIGKEGEDKALTEPGTSTTIMRGRPMHGWLDLSPEAVETEEQLRNWLERVLDFVQSLPPKEQ